MFLIAILSDSKNEHCLANLDITNAKTSWYRLNDDSWLQVRDKIDLLIVAYDAYTQMPDQLLKYKEKEGRCIILPVCVADKICLPPKGLDDLAHVCFPDERETLTRRIHSHLGAKNLSKRFNTVTSIFISYRTKADHEKVRLLVNAFRNFDYSVTWDKEWKEYIDNPKGNRDKEIIDKYLSGSSFIILIHTKHTKESEHWIWYEIESSRAVEKPIQKLSFDTECCDKFGELIERCASLGQSQFDNQVSLAITEVENYLATHYLNDSKIRFATA